MFRAIAVLVFLFLCAAAMGQHAPAPLLTDQFGNQWARVQGKDGGDLLAVKEAGKTQWEILGPQMAIPAGWNGPVTDDWGYLWITGPEGNKRLDPRKEPQSWESRSLPASASTWQRNWQELPRLPFGNHDIVGAVLGDKLYLAGGIACHGLGGKYKYFDTLLVYDPNALSWTMAPPMSKARCYAAAAEMGGSVWVIGGGVDRGGVRVPVDLVQCYDPKAGRWSDAPALDVSRMEAVAATVGGRLYVLGGSDNADNRTLATMISIGLSENAWRREPDLPVPMRQYAGCVLADKIYVCIGKHGLFSYDPVRQQWQRLPATPSGKPPRAALVAAHKGEVWVMGGQDVENGLATWVYSPGTSRWRAGPELPLPMSWGAAVSLGGRLMIAGGACYAPEHKYYIFWERAFALRQ